MSLKVNILAVYSSQIYITAIGIIVFPIYLRYMGPEVFGLVGFFTTLQAMFNLLDIGLKSTIIRETARLKNDENGIVNYLNLHIFLEKFFFVICVLASLLIVISSSLITSHWLNFKTIDFHTVRISIILMAIAASTRVYSGYYKGILNGAEKLIYLSTINTMTATFRFLVAIPLVIISGDNPIPYFIYQTLISIIELVAVKINSNKIIPKINNNRPNINSFLHIKPIIKFSLSVAMTSTIWVIVTQTDKLILSNLLTLSDYGYFSISVIIASGIIMLSTPLSSILIPRITRLESYNKMTEIIEIYRKTTQYLCIIIMPTAFTLSIFSQKILWVWTGDIVAAETAAPILSSYSIGNALLTIAALPYYIQYAKGNLRLHLAGSIIFLVILIPSLIIATTNYGMVGAGWVWATTNLLYLILWVPIIHRYFLPKIHYHWIFIDILPMFVSAGITSYIFFKLVDLSSNRLILFFELALIGTIVFLITALSSTFFRTKINLKSNFF